MLWYKRFITGTSYQPIVGMLEKSPKFFELEDQRMSLTSPLEAQCRWTTQPGSGKQGLSSCRGEPQRRAGGDIYGRLLPLHLVVGPESLFVSRASSWEQELAADRSTRPDGIYRQPVSVSHCVTHH